MLQLLGQQFRDILFLLLWFDVYDNVVKYLTDIAMTGQSHNLCISKYHHNKICTLTNFGKLEITISINVI